MNRGYLALGAAFVLAAVLGLYVLLRDANEDVATTRAPAGPKIAGDDHAKVRSPATRPALGEHAPPAPGAGAAAGESTAGDVRVRDHRSGSGEQAPIEVVPPIQPPDGRKIPSRLTFDISQRLRAPLAECAAALPPEARGAKPYLEGEIRIAIKDQQATITGATYQTRDVTGEAQAAFKQCMEQKSVGAAVPSGDEPDVEGYPIALSFRLP